MYMLGDAALQIRQRAAALLRYVMRSAAHVHLWHQVLFASVCKSVVWDECVVSHTLIECVGG